MSFSDDSDLTDLSSEESDVPLAVSKPQTRVKTRKQPVITPALRAPRTVSYSVECLYSALGSFFAVCDWLNLCRETKRWSPGFGPRVSKRCVVSFAMSLISPLIFSRCRLERREAKPAHRLAHSQLLHTPFDLRCVELWLALFLAHSSVVAVSVMPNGEEKRTCIDGKQRLSSIQRFTDGLVRVSVSTSILSLTSKQIMRTPPLLISLFIA